MQSTTQYERKMIRMQYEIWKDEEDEGTITVLHEGQLYAANTDHPAWDEIVKGAIAEDSAIIDLFDRTAVIARHFDKLSERVTVGHGRVQFDGNEVDTALTQHILRTLADSPEVIDYMPFVNFLEKVETNPNEHSREQLYEFLRAHDFTITLEGDFVAYKGVDSEGRSITSGNATVDGNVIRGKIPNEVGSIIEMPRLSVEHNPNQDCSTGLHAATHSFAQGFGSKVLSILVNPRDVVSVPAHGNAEKIRVCRYRVLEIVEDSPYQGTVIDEDEFDEDIDLNEETDEDPSYLDDNIDDEDLGAIG